MIFQGNKGSSALSAGWGIRGEKWLYGYIYVFGIFLGYGKNQVLSEKECCRI